MMSAVAVEVPSTAHLLQYAISRPSPSTLIICLPEEQFLNGVLSELDSPNGSSAGLEVGTIRALSMSSQVKVIFAPELMHLRAYLSTLATPRSKDSMDTNDETALIIFGMLDQMRGPGNFHVQNSMRTCALTVDAAATSFSKLVLAESPNLGSDELHNDANNPSRDPWIEGIPMLAGTTRLGEEAGDWTGRRVQTRRVVGRWCKFVQWQDLT